MKILMLHNTYRIRGGEDESFESEVRMLTDAGHFVETIHLNNDRVEEIGLVKVALQSIWSEPSYALVDRKLQERQYDVLHVQNFFPLLSPSVYSAAKKHGVAVVQTLRNYRLLCPSSIFFRDGHICEDCLGKTFQYPGILHGCYRHSRLGSATVATMNALHNIKGTWRNAVDLYISLTEFSRQKFIQAGFPPDKILVKSNFVYPDPGCGNGTGGYALFVGRLTPEKGVETLLSAWDLLKSSCSLKIVGEGPLTERVQDFCKLHPEVEFLGARRSAEVKQLMGEAAFLVFPSEWYETFGRVAIESFAKGTPVIASRLGAMAEIVQEMHTGMLFEPGNAADLANKVQWAIENPNQISSMRPAVRRVYETKYTADENCRALIRAYEAAQRSSASQVSRRIGMPTASYGQETQQTVGSQMRLTAEQVQFYNDYGYLRLDAVAPKSEVREIKSRLEKLLEQRVGEKEGAFADLIAGDDPAAEMSSPQILNPVNYAPELRKTQCFQNALQIAKQLLGEEARCFFDLTIVKKPRIGAPTPWHQDLAFRDPRFEYKELTIWVAMQDVVAETGCLQFIPGSHKNPVLEHQSANNDPTSQALQCCGDFDRSSAVACALPTGGCTIHGPGTLHSAGPNISDTPRLAYIMVFGVPPTPAKQPRTFPWLDHKQTAIQARKRRWMRRGGVFVTIWRRLRRGDLKNWQSAFYGLKRSIRILIKGI